MCQRVSADQNICVDGTGICIWCMNILALDLYFTYLYLDLNVRVSSAENNAHETDLSDITGDNHAI